MKNHTLTEGMRALIEVRKKNSRATEFFVVKVTDVTDSGWIHAELAGGETRRFKVDAGPEDEPYIRRRLSSRAKLRGPISEEAAMKIWEAEKGKLKDEPKAARTTRKKAPAKAETDGAPAKPRNKKDATKKAPARRRAKAEDEEDAPKPRTRKKAAAKATSKKTATKKAPARRRAKAEDEEKPATGRRKSPTPVTTRRRRSVAA